MVEVYSKALDSTISVGRYINKIVGAKPGPSVVFICGMHGNEPSGIFAIRKVIKLIKERNINIKGSIHALAGNLHALSSGQRYDRYDLNRLWSDKNMAQLENQAVKSPGKDVQEQIQLFEVIKDILNDDNGPFYFMDLHTTSSETVPFVVMNDCLLNRKFTSQYPVPIILGIEEYLEGPLLSYINEYGYVAFGFEAGQHDDLSSIENHEAFIILSLVFSGSVDKKEVDFSHFYNVLAKNSLNTINFYEIFYRYKIKEGEKFNMAPGYYNFQHIRKGQILAESNGKPLIASTDAQVFMPLYQSQGSEGFFAIKKIPQFYMRLSEIIRRLRTNRLLPLLPGVSWHDEEKATLKVNKRIARFFTKQFFHLMGYRRKKLDKNHYIMKNRESSLHKDDYESCPWWR